MVKHNHFVAVKNRLLLFQAQKTRGRYIIKVMITQNKKPKDKGFEKNSEFVRMPIIIRVREKMEIKENMPLVINSR